MIRPLEKRELLKIEQEISTSWDSLVRKYDSRKYPEDAYKKMLEAFSSRVQNNIEIENSMMWKWGHWGKDNYPSKQQALVSEIKLYWADYIYTDFDEPQKIFDFWQSKLGKGTRYISVAFITHLIHPHDVPIIDQHNFRAFNHLLQVSGRTSNSKKKPSSWVDLVNLKLFMSSISEHLSKDERQLDKFLMMYGRHITPR